MPKSNRKTQLPKKLRSESPPPELEDAVAPEFTEGEASAETPTPGTYVVSEADTASGTSSATEDNFIPPLPVVPAPKGKAPATSPPTSLPEPAPRLVDTANLLFAHSPRPHITFETARGERLTSDVGWTNSNKRPLQDLSWYKGREPPALRLGLPLLRDLVPPPVPPPAQP